LTVYVAWIDESRGLAALAGVAGVALILAALLVAWDDGLVVGSALLLVAYALSLADRGEAVDRAAPLVALALLAVVDFGSWSLELRDGAEERPLARLPSVFCSSARRSPQARSCSSSAAFTQAPASSCGCSAPRRQSDYSS